MTRTALHACCVIVVSSPTMSVQNYMQVAEYNVTVAESAPQADTRSICVIRTTVEITF